jgi:hypothetical protein
MPASQNRSPLTKFSWSRPRSAWIQIPSRELQTHSDTEACTPAVHSPSTHDRQPEQTRLSGITSSHMSSQWQGRWASGQSYNPQCTRIHVTRHRTSRTFYHTTRRKPGNCPASTCSNKETRPTFPSGCPHTSRLACHSDHKVWRAA